MKASLLIVVALLSGCAATQKTETPRSEDYPYVGRPRLVEAEWTEIKKQFALREDYDLMAVTRQTQNELFVQLTSKRNPYKGRVLWFKSEAGHWTKTSDDETTIQY